MNIKKAEEIIGYKFKDITLPVLAFTHSSYANEREKDPLVSNERLEFLGDAVLETVVSEMIYKKYPKRPEGDLTRIRALVVCEAFLGKLAISTGLNELLLLGKGEEAAGGRKRVSIISDMMESVIAAVYLDGGLEEARRLVENWFGNAIEEAASGSVLRGDSKTALQELLQKHGAVDIEYEIISESGPDHAKSFEAEVKRNGRVIGRGKGRSKKCAEAAAASEALRRMQKNGHTEESDVF